MTDQRVVDASALAAFLLREPDGRKIDSILPLVESGKCELHAPAILEYEMVNILAMAERKGRIHRNQVPILLHEWNTIPITQHTSTTPNIRTRILNLASQHRLTAYDAAYVELAERIPAQLITLDRDLLALKKLYRWIS
ncbi:MAG TPA: type II toxin-antitoxin system VapC family toxin [Kiritimatiellia bacterium]|nr:type II toxin-antitoxin system VapC family toxin [Kiritimatiellia bacterium]HMP34462.1 type II toxin-antitoxin system VapC family toxin [Kiritimatiellia bacterium]